MTPYRIKPKHRSYSLRRDWRTFGPVLAVFAVPLLIALLVLVKVSWTERPQKLPAGQDLHLNISKLRTNHLHLFETNIAGEKVQFVVERTEDNAVHVAVAACPFCYRSRRSNRVQDGVVMCARCNGPMSFESKTTNGGANSCDLAEIPHSQTAQTLTVLRRDIAQTVEKLGHQ